MRNRVVTLKNHFGEISKLLSLFCMGKSKHLTKAHRRLYAAKAWMGGIHIHLDDQSEYRRGTKDSPNWRKEEIIPIIYIHLRGYTKNINVAEKEDILEWIIRQMENAEKELISMINIMSINAELKIVYDHIIDTKNELKKELEETIKYNS
jgi:hypothetical protein